MSDTLFINVTGENPLQCPGYMRYLQKAVTEWIDAQPSHANEPEPIQYQPKEDEKIKPNFCDILCCVYSHGPYYRGPWY